MHTNPIPDPVADPTRDPESDPLTPPSPGHHNDEPQRPEGPPDKDPVLRCQARLRAVISRPVRRVRSPGSPAA